MADQSPDDRTIPARGRRAPARQEGGDPEPGPAPVSRPPWLLERHYSGQVDLSRELSQRFPTLPLLSVFRRRGVPGSSAYASAMLASQDGVATMIWEAVAGQAGVQITYSFASMLALRFHLDELTATAGMRWLELIRAAQKGTAFLWGASRWEHDYAIGAVDRQFINLFAFSPRGYEAGARLTPEVRAELFDWLDGVWRSGTPPDEPAQLLTW